MGPVVEEAGMLGGPISFVRVPFSYATIVTDSVFVASMAHDMPGILLGSGNTLLANQTHILFALCHS